MNYLTQEEKSMYEVLCNTQYEIDKTSLSLQEGYYLYGKDEDTKRGKWSVSQQGDEFIVRTNPDVGKFQVAIYLHKV